MRDKEDYTVNEEKKQNTDCRDKNSGTPKHNEEYHESTPVAPVVQLVTS